jgi:hypothetical protein
MKRAAVLTAGLVGILVLPAIRSRDSFPLSTYPMYASARGREATFSTVVGVDSDGKVRRLSMQQIARTDDPLITHQRVRDEIRGGRAGELCIDVAAQVTSEEIVAVEVVEERHDIVLPVEERSSQLARVVHARCAA